MSFPASIKEAFAGFSKGSPRLFAAPGRVNLIGEHTDYNDGFVMPAAINFRTFAAVSPRSDNVIRVASSNLEGQEEFTVASAVRTGTWTDYVKGVAVKLEENGFSLKGADLLIESNVPIGAGLSSSAALEVATAHALLSLSEKTVDLKQVARICQQAENEFVGMNCGIMDQFVSSCAETGHALLLDCRSLETRSLPLPNSLSLVVCNSMVKHSLASSAYNTRRAECEEAARLLDVKALRDIRPVEFEARKGILPDPVRRRAHHVISENDRVQKAAESLMLGDLAEFGSLMYQSHSSLKLDYEVSCPELDLLVEIARNTLGVVGARMTGGGFGGCTINLVEKGSVESFCTQIRTEYESVQGVIPDVYVCEAVGGVSEVN